MNQSERRNFLIQSLLEESREYRGMQIPSDSTGQRQLLRGLMNVRMVKKSSAEFLNIQDAYLQEETAKKGVTNVDDLTPVQQGLYLWQGDITALRCDAIVNAANSGMTGCYVPNHRCIDNCIHTFAGVQLRLYCEDVRSRNRKAICSVEEPEQRDLITGGLSASTEQVAFRLKSVRNPRSKNVPISPRNPMK